MFLHKILTIDALVKNDAGTPRIVAPEEVDLVRWKHVQIKLEGRVVPSKETRNYDNSIKDLRSAIETLAIIDDNRRWKETYKE